MSIWDSFLDKTIVFSFDSTGFNRHQKKFDEDILSMSFDNKKILITGATNGIGEEVASLTSKLNAVVTITGRNKKKGEEFESQNKNSKFVSLDMANWKELHEFAKNSNSIYDFLVFNAGSMPEAMNENEFGVEFQSSSQLFGHYYLLYWLKLYRKISPGAKVVWVSSGGMYLKKLDLGSLVKNAKYDKVDTYANVKRAQVTLVEELAKKDEWKDIFLYSMHPGWVGTQGLKDALPSFYNMMKNRLRSIYQGADTILWCLLSKKSLVSGGFYFDRQRVSPIISKKYEPSSKEREELLRILEEKRPVF